MDDTMKYRALASKVLAVAVVSVDGLRVYVDAVPGYDHKEEWEAVARHGDKQSKEIAKAIFPEYSELPYVH